MIHIKMEYSQTARELLPCLNRDSTTGCIGFGGHRESCPAIYREAVAQALREAHNKQICADYIEEYPCYYQGPPQHELQEHATAEECNGMVQEIIKLRQRCALAEQQNDRMRQWFQERTNSDSKLLNDHMRLLDERIAELEKELLKNE